MLSIPINVFCHSKELLILYSVYVQGFKKCVCTGHTRVGHPLHFSTLYTLGTTVLPNIYRHTFTTHIHVIGTYMVAH